MVSGRGVCRPNSPQIHRRPGAASGPTGLPKDLSYLPVAIPCGHRQIKPLSGKLRHCFQGASVRTQGPTDALTGGSTTLILVSFQLGCGLGSNTFSLHSNSTDLLQQESHREAPDKLQVPSLSPEDTFQFHWESKETE